jgi:cation diffusion facilitator CzcD-associated flavoprotein CzcO
VGVGRDLIAVEGRHLQLSFGHQTSYFTVDYRNLAIFTMQGNRSHCAKDMQLNENTGSGTSSDIKGQPKRNNGPCHYELDVVIVGGGFAGIYLLHSLRKEGLNVKIVEAGHGLGGVWYWNSYPGARVDTPSHTYALNIPEVYRTWTWSQEYPDDKELRQYFQHIDKVLDISKDTVYGEKINKATFHEARDKWTLESDGGSTFTASFFCSCIGFAAKRYLPAWPGIDDAYKGYILHSSFWPAEGIDTRGKKVAIVGTGATGVQIGQEVARDADKLTCFVRTPNLTWPMRNRSIDRSIENKEEETANLGYLLGEKRFTNSGGFTFDETTRKVMDDTPEERESRLNQEYQYGGFRIFFSCYIDVMMDPVGNEEIYKFWQRKTRERMTDPKKAALLAPIKPPHPFAGKRPSLEHDYYEMMDKPHVTLVDVNTTPVTHAVAKGLVTSDNVLHEADIVILATGFDAITGGFRDIEITGLWGKTLAEKWNDGIHAHLGMTVSGFPNMFYTYGPFAPTAYGNGPAIVESQADWIVHVMRRMRSEGLTRIDATLDAEAEWKEKVISIHAMTLRHNVEGSWYLGYVTLSHHLTVYEFRACAYLFKTQCARQKARTAELGRWASVLQKIDLGSRYS